MYIFSLLFSILLTSLESTDWFFLIFNYFQSLSLLVSSVQSCISFYHIHIIHVVKCIRILPTVYVHLFYNDTYVLAIFCEGFFFFLEWMQYFQLDQLFQSCRLDTCYAWFKTTFLHIILDMTIQKFQNHPCYLDISTLSNMVSGFKESQTFEF